MSQVVEEIASEAALTGLHSAYQPQFGRKWVLILPRHGHVLEVVTLVMRLFPISEPEEPLGDPGRHRFQLGGMINAGSSDHIS